MIVPNKVISYEDSLMSKLPVILRRMAVSATPSELYSDLQADFDEMSNFLLALDVLFVLGKITIKDGELRVC